VSYIPWLALLGQLPAGGPPSKPATVAYPKSRVRLDFRHVHYDRMDFNLLRRIRRRFSIALRRDCFSSS
jgi:hypothetical protein